MNDLADIKMRAADALAEIDNLEGTVEAFLRSTGMSRRRFGVAAVGDPDFVRRLVQGRKRPNGALERCNFQIETIRGALRFIGEYEL